VALRGVFMSGAESFAVGILLGLVAGLVNGIFLLPMRYTKKWAWENVWLCFTILSTGVFPWIAAWVAVPHLADVFRSVSFSAFVPGLVAGLVWGVAQVMYGLSCGMVGIAIGSAAISCTAIISGILGPMIVYAPSKLISTASLVLLVATTLIIAGVYMDGKAGARKERETAGAEVKQLVGGSFRVGMTMCLICGVLGTAFVYGGKSSTALLAAARSTGAPPMLAFYVAYLVTFNAGAVPGILYSLYKLKQNNTGGNFLTSGALLWNLAMATAMALLWYSGLLCYGMASEELGRIGASVAFALFSGGTILFANLFGWLAGEWKGASRETIKGFVKGMVMIVGAILIIAFGISVQ
jgi:L-rhamnose-H+ transport protein